MTAPAQPKRGEIKVDNKKSSSFGGSLSLISSERVKLFEIAIRMKKSGLSDIFIDNTVSTALEFEGVADLMNLWDNEKNAEDRNEIIADIQDMIDACSQKNKSEELYIKFNDLDAIAKDIRAFKDSLYQEVIQFGGISKLSELTGIPQPSLSRFFNSNSMPQRATILKIAKALDLDGIKMDIFWSK